MKFFFSIVCATFNNKKNISKLINSLKKQKKKNFELIICDQNKNNYIKKNILINKPNNFRIKYIKTKLGLSRSRNEGIKNSKGKYLIFFDDDITINNDFLYNLQKIIINKNLDLICYKTVNQPENKPLLKYPKKNKYIDSISDVFKYISSVSFAIKKRENLFFDEKIGLGSKKIFLSGEETDMLIKEIKNCKRIFFTKNLKINHWNNHNVNFINHIIKSFYYGCGWSYVVKKNNLGIFFIFKNIFKVILNLFFHLLSLNIKKYLYL